MYLFIFIQCTFSGSPIRDFNIEFEDTANNYYTEKEAVYKIPVKGPDGHGYYFIKAQPRGEGGKWVGVKLELELEMELLLNMDCSALEVCQKKSVTNTVSRLHTCILQMYLFFSLLVVLLLLLKSK